MFLYEGSRPKPWKVGLLSQVVIGVVCYSRKWSGALLLPSLPLGRVPASSGGFSIGKLWACFVFGFSEISEVCGVRCLTFN